MQGRSDALQRKHIEQIGLVRAATQSLQLPKSLRQRIESHQHYLAMAQNLSSYQHLFSGLSTNLFAEVKAHIYKSLFINSTFFNDAPEQFNNAMALIMEEVNYSPGHSIVRQGEVGSEMYFILRGKCDVMGGTKLEVVHQLTENSYFGEVALL